MPQTEASTEIFRPLSTDTLLLTAAILIATWVAATLARWALRSLAESSPAGLRLRILRVIPIARLCVGLTGLALVVRMLIEPSLQNLFALAASVGLALAFVFKDYASSLAAGLVTVLENTLPTRRLGGD